MLALLLSLMCPGFFLVQKTSAQVGNHGKPSLSAWPDYVVHQGQHVTLRCYSHEESDIFKVYKEYGTPIPHLLDKTFQKDLLLGPLTSAYGGTYRCYCYRHQSPDDISGHSDPLKIIISGIYKKPFLLALPTPLVKSGEELTLECHSEVMFEIFILIVHRNGRIQDSCHLSAESHHGGSQATFSIGPVTTANGGTYTCYGSYRNTPYEWSDPSDPIDIRITGLFNKPSLSAQPGPVEMSGENTTLSCISEHQFDMFHLSREGVPQIHGLPEVQRHSGSFQANFFLGPVIQPGTYSCYGSFNMTSHLWSSPSDPLYLPGRVNSSRNCPSCTETKSNTNGHSPLHILSGLSATMALVFLIFLLRYLCSAKKNKPRDATSECDLSNVRNQDQRNSDAAIMDQESEVRRTENRQDPDKEGMQEVTYTEFHQLIFKPKLTTRISQRPKEFSTGSSVYMECVK